MPAQCLEKQLLILFLVIYSDTFFKTLINLDFLFCFRDSQQCSNIQKWYKFRKLHSFLFFVFPVTKQLFVTVYNSFSKKSLNCLENYKGKLSLVFDLIFYLTMTVFLEQFCCSEQNWREGTEVFHISLAPTHD